MKKIDGINIGIHDVGRRKTRSFLTIVAIGVGCMLLVAMQSMGSTIETTATEFIESFGHMDEVMVLPQKYSKKDNFALKFNEESNSGSQLLPYTKNVQVNPKAKDNSKKISDAQLKKLSKIEGVKTLTAYDMRNGSSVEIDGIKKKGDPFTVIGYNSSYHYTGQQEIVKGSDLSKSKDGVLVNKDYLEHWDVKDPATVIGKKITLICSVPETEGISIPPLKIEKKIRGVYKTENSHVPGDVMGFDDITKKITAYYTGKKVKDISSSYSMVVLRTKDDKAVNPVVKEINNKIGYSTFNVGQIIGLARVFSSFVSGILSIGALIVIIVASVGLVNTMTMTIQEKRKWIGIMRSIGAKKGDIVTIFLSQAVLIGILGAILGCLLAYLGIFGINAYLNSAEKNFNILLTWSNISFGSIVTVAVPVIAGVIPAKKAARMNVVEVINED